MGQQENITLNESKEAVKYYLSDDCATICFYRAESEFDFLKFSAESRISSIISPANLSIKNVYEFADAFDANYLYSSNDEVVDIFSSKMTLRSTPFPNLSRIVTEDTAN